jgi:hypothetical protein
MGKEHALGTRICGDCGANPGDYHERGCDVERCPRCKGQAIGCRCVQEFSGIVVPKGIAFMESFNWLEKHHPEIYNEGPPAEMYQWWDLHWKDKRLRWTGVWPGKLECQELGFWCRDLWKDTGEVMVGYDFDEIRRRGVNYHIRCAAGDEGAHEDLNRYARHLAATRNPQTNQRS